MRTARHQRGLSLAETASRVGVTKGFLSQIERDLNSPSVATLLSICRELDLPVGALFDAPTAPLVRAHERQPISFGGEGMSEFRLTPATEQRVLVLMSDIAPGGGSGKEPYGLDAETEFLHVLDGLLDLQMGDRHHRLAAGDSMTFDPSRPHHWHNPSAAVVARVMWVVVPGLAM